MAPLLTSVSFPVKCGWPFPAHDYLAIWRRRSGQKQKGQPTLSTVFSLFSSSLSTNPLYLRRPELKNVLEIIWSFPLQVNGQEFPRNSQWMEDGIGDIPVPHSWVHHYQLPEAEGPLPLFQLKMLLILSCELIKEKKKKRNQTQSGYSVNVCRMNVILQN